MNKQEIFSRIVSDLKKAYLNFDEPNFAFAGKQYNSSSYFGIIKAIAERFYIKIIGDLNDEVCYQISIKDEGNEWVLNLSLVGRYALLMRVDTKLNRVVDIVGDFSETKSATEQIILKCLNSDSFTILNKELAEYPFKLNLSNTEIEHVRLYQALFSDVDILPWE